MVNGFTVRPWAGTREPGGGGIGDNLPPNLEVLGIRLKHLRPCHIVSFWTNSHLCINIFHGSSLILRITYPPSSVTPPLAGPSGRRPPGMWRSPEPSPGNGGRPGLRATHAAWRRWWQPPKASLGHPVTSTLACSNPSPSSHGSEMVKTDRRGLILTKPNQKYISEQRQI